MNLISYSTSAQPAPALEKGDVATHDCIVVRTANSTYELRLLRSDLFRVRGGWFDREKSAPVKTTVTGCGPGGTAVKTGVIAECGLRLEFGNRILTSPIRGYILFRHFQLN